MRPLPAIVAAQIAVFLIGMTCALVDVFQLRASGWVVLATVALLILLVLRRVEHVIRKANS